MTATNDNAAPARIAHDYFTRMTPVIKERRLAVTSLPVIAG
jgi:hypothetical protein